MKLAQSGNGLKVMLPDSAVESCGCLPEFHPEPCEQPVINVPCQPVAECSTMLGWAVWLSEVIVGIDSPDKDIAANYVRQTAIRFADEARVIRRHLKIRGPIAPAEFSLPVQEGERVGGVINVEAHSDCGPPMYLRHTMASADCVRLLDNRCCGDTWRSTIDIEYYVVPTEDALRFDEILYNKYRADIAEAARADYVRAVHFRDYKLLRSVQTKDVFEHAISKARHALTKVNSAYRTYESAL